MDSRTLGLVTDLDRGNTSFQMLDLSDRIISGIISGGNHEFDYFTQAPWMNKSATLEHFIYKAGEITVKQSGIFIIHSNVSTCV